MLSKVVSAAISKEVAKEQQDFNVAALQNFDQNIDQESSLELTAPVNDMTKLRQIVGGILKGALDAEGFGDITRCFGDAEEIFKDAEDLVKLIESDDKSKVLDGIKEIAKMLKDIKSAVGDCKDIMVDLKKLEAMVEIFASPMSFVYHVGKDLIVNGVQIFHEIEDATVQYKAQNWEQFGIDIGEATAKTLLGEESLKQVGHSDDQIKLAQIEQGILQAYGGKFDLYALLVCIGEEDKALLMFDVAVQQIEKVIQDKDPKTKVSDAIAGVIAAIAGVQQIKQGLPACEAVDTSSFDFNKFEDAFDTMSHPIEHFKVLEDDIILNKKSIKKDLRKALKGYYKQDYVQFGYHLGNMLNLATEEPQLEEPKKQATKQDLASFVQGYLEATHVGQFNYTNLLECIYVMDQAAITLYFTVQIAEQFIEKKDFGDLLGATLSALATLTGVQQALPFCENIDKDSMDWTYFDEIMEVVESPAKHMSVIDNDVIFNGLEITKGLFSVLDDVKSENYRQFGYDLGMVMYYATEEPEQFDNMYIY